MAPTMSHVFPRVARELPTAVSAEGAWITAADGTRYLDAAGGAIVVGVGHGDRSLIDAADRAAGTHAVRARHDVHDRGARDLRRRGRDRAPARRTRAVYPVSGGSEAVETAIKMARALPPGAGPARAGST